MPRKDNKCTLLVYQAIDEMWTLGWQSIKPYCWRFDYDSNEVAFAKPEH